MGRYTKIYYNNFGEKSEEITIFTDSNFSIKQQFNYDQFGRLIENEIIKINGTDAETFLTKNFTYDEKTGRLISGIYTKDLIFHYDGFGRNTGYSLDNSRKTQIGFSPKNGRLNSMKIGAENTKRFTWHYLANTDLFAKFSYPNGIEKKTNYEEKRDLISRISFSQNTTNPEENNSVNEESFSQNTTNLNTILSFTSQNNQIGLRTNTEIAKIALSAESPAQNNGRVSEKTFKNTAYIYNPRNELIASISEKSSETFSYDNLGNRISTVNSDETKNYTTNNLNQYINLSETAAVAETSNSGPQSIENEILSHAQLSSETAALNSEAAAVAQTFIPTYDLNGNQTLIKTINNGSKTPGIWNVEYNGENRPIKWTSDSKKIEMNYDFMGRRIS